MNYDQNNKSDNRKRKFFGMIFLLPSLFCFLPKLLLYFTDNLEGLDLRTYTQKPTFLLFNLFCLPFGVIGLYFLLTKEPLPNIKNKKSLTPDEIKNNIRAWFVIMICSLAPVMTSAFLLLFIRHWLLYAFFLLAVAFWAVLMIFKRCPVCGYRIIYGHPGALPPNKCVRCGTKFREI
jgi:hypothetical protein